MMSFIDELIMIVVWHIDFLGWLQINVINSLQILKYFILFEMDSFRLVILGYLRIILGYLYCWRPLGYINCHEDYN